MFHLSIFQFLSLFLSPFQSISVPCLACDSDLWPAVPEKRTVPDEEGGFQTPVTLAETFELDAIASDLRRAIAKQTDSLE